MRKHPKDNQTKALLKYIKKERRNAYWDMPIPNLHLFLVVVALILILSSYNVFAKNPWISSFFQSCGTGIITGIVVFLLGNIRSKSKEDVDKQVEQLTALYEIIKRVYDSVPDKFIPKNIRQKYNYKECVIDAIEAADEYVKTIKKLDFPIKKKFIKETSINYLELASDIDKFKEMELSDNLNYHSALEILNEIIRILQKSADWFEDALGKAEIQKDQIRKYPF